MVDKENLGDNNMFQSRWDDFTDEGAFLHSHAGFLNSVLFKAKKHSKRKHAYPANVIPAQREREREKSNAELSKGCWLPPHSQMLPKQCSSSE